MAFCIEVLWMILRPRFVLDHDAVTVKNAQKRIFLKVIRGVSLEKFGGLYPVRIYDLLYKMPNFEGGVEGVFETLQGVEHDER